MNAQAYGFRHSLKAWLSDAEGLAAARVRLSLNETATDGDKKLLEEEIATTLREQRPDGSFGDTTGQTGGELAKLLGLGCDPGSPEIRRGLDALMSQHRDGKGPKIDGADPAHEYARAGALPDEAIRALCLGQRGDADEVRFSADWLVSHLETWLGHPYGCPWGPNTHLQALWLARESTDVSKAIEMGLSWLNHGLDEAGLLGHLDPWGTVQTAGAIDLPEARSLAVRLLPMLLRGQMSDGGWDGHSFEAISALNRTGMIDELSNRPALPCDWTVAVQFPFPGKSFRHLGWDGEFIWVHDAELNEAVGISRNDGSETARIPLPVQDIHGLTWIDGNLAVCQGGPWKPVKNLLLVGRDGHVLATHSLDKVAMAIGVANVDGRLWIGDGFDFEARILDLDSPDVLSRVKWPGTCARDLTASSAGVWHIDSFAPLMIECDQIGQMLDWAEIPFYGALGGVTWDGEQLWMLNTKTSTLCAATRA